MKSGWWCNNHLEKYEFVNGKDDMNHEMENKKCLKPPTRNILRSKSCSPSLPRMIVVEDC
jgi:hypothetical protein